MLVPKKSSHRTAGAVLQFPRRRGSQADQAGEAPNDLEQLLVTVSRLSKKPAKVRALLRAARKVASDE